MKHSTRWIKPGRHPEMNMNLRSKPSSMTSMMRVLRISWKVSVTTIRSPSWRTTCPSLAARQPRSTTASGRTGKITRSLLSTSKWWSTCYQFPRKRLMRRSTPLKWEKNGWNSSDPASKEYSWTLIELWRTIWATHWKLSSEIRSWLSRISSLFVLCLSCIAGPVTSRRSERRTG